MLDRGRSVNLDLHQSNVEFTSSPVAALVGAALVVGCERQENGDVWLYLHARYLDEYVGFPAGEGADAAERAWNATHCTHLWVRITEPESA